MSGTAPDLHVDATGIRVAVIAARWHPELVDAMLAHAAQAAQDAGADFDPERDLYRVAGAGELPVVARALIEAPDSRYRAVAAYGVIIRGGTPHFESVAARAADGLLAVAVQTGIPVSDGVLAVYDEAGARVRVGLTADGENKGAETMIAALDAAATIRRLADPQ